MKPEEITMIIIYLISECTKLKDKYVEEKNLKIDYVCIFSHDDTEYKNLYEVSKELGTVAKQTPTGDIFAFNPKQKLIPGNPILKIRKPDPTRPQRGDVDFNTNYADFKIKYLDNNRFTLIDRGASEMIELKDKSFNVLVYFSSIPPSKQFGIT